MDQSLTLPVAQLQEWADALKRNAEEIARLTAEREAIKAKMNAARLLFGDSVPAVDAPKETDQGVTLVAFIADQIAKAPAGITLVELSNAIRRSELAGRFARNPNALYTAVGRLVERSEVVRDGRLLYSPESYKRVSAGEIEHRGSGGEKALRELVLDAVKAAGKGLTSGEILDTLRKDPVVAERLANFPQVGYNAISRLRRRGELTKHGNRYMLPSAADDFSDLA